MAELKTKLDNGDVHMFLNSFSDEKKRPDSFTILKLTQEATNAEPNMRGDNSLVLAAITTNIPVGAKAIGS